MTSYFGYESFMTASKVLYRLLSRPHNGRMIVTPGTDAEASESSLDGIWDPPYRFRLRLSVLHLQKQAEPSCSRGPQSQQTN